MLLSVMYLADKILEVRSAQAHERVGDLGISPSLTSNCRFTDLNNTAAMVGGNAFPVCFLMSVL